MAKQPSPIDPIVAELTAIKRLLVCVLMRSGASQGEIGKALGINQSNVSRMFPNGRDESKAKAKGSKKGKA